MEPENKKERKVLYIRFLALFILGIIIVLIPFYFTLSLPAKESKESNEELQMIKQAVKSHEEFFVYRMDSVQKLFSDFEKEDEDIDMLNAKIVSLLVEMEQYINSDTVWRSGMNKNIVATYESLKKTHKTILDKDEEISELNKTLKLSKRKQRQVAKTNESEDSLD